MTLRLDYNCILDTTIGGEHGLSLASIQANSGKIREVHDGLQKRRESGELGFFDVPYHMGVADRVKAWADSVAGDFDYFVHIGIGGSGLGPICVQAALNSPCYNEGAAFRTANGRTYPRLYIIDNVDPEMIAEVDRVIDIRRTLFHVVSKSGTTPETMTAFMYFLEKLRVNVGDHAIGRQFVFTTDPAKGVLRELANKWGVTTFDIPPNVGGRFSVLTPVGLVPAALTGVDIHGLLRGAARMQDRCETSDLMRNPAAFSALVHYMMDVEKGKKIVVMMPYIQSLRFLSAWFVQLWAESLGKAHDVNGKLVNVGQTPLGALGATDQHSQVQLFAEGPNDKLLLFLEASKFRHQCTIPAASAGLEEMRHFGEFDFSRLLNTEKDATEFALARQQRPSMTLKLHSIDAETVGELFHFFELQTAYAGGLYNINAFDQPGVEEGKRATHALMGRGKPEDEAKLAEVKAFKARLTAEPLA